MANFTGKLLTKIFGSRNERILKRIRKIVDQVNALEPKVQAMTDAQLRARTQEIRAGLVARKLKPVETIPESLAIIRESMDRHIGIRQIFNPEETFDPDKFDDEALHAYDLVQQRMIQSGESWEKVEIAPSIYAAVRKLYPDSRPPFRARCFDVQLIGGLTLYEGKIAEMATGEGKTFVAPLACFLRVLEGFHCHVVTVNDYLVKRDSTWTKPAFENLGLSVSYIQSDMDPGGDGRRRSYQADVTYGTNSEFGFDFLRDNMKERAELQVQGPLDFAIVDEVDSILIDEARTPLIISGAAHDDAPKYRAADVVARKVLDLHRPYAIAEKAVDAAKRAIKTAEGDEEKTSDKAGKEAARARRADAEKQLAAAEHALAKEVQYYEVELDRKSVHLTHEGIAAAQEEAGVGSFYVGNNMEWPHLMEQALRAHVVYEKDKDYVVERGPRGEMEVVIVDEFTGRKMNGRQWSDGLHQATEAKERVPIKQESQTMATITLQNFFKMYRSLSGMTGTAQTEAEEFSKIYKLEVVTIPTNRPAVRQDNEDRVYRSEREKWDAIIEEIKEYSDSGRPVLVGTTSVEKSEMLSTLLKRKYGIEHEVLNAKYHEREAHIVEHGGLQHVNGHGETVGNVTIATNMAGRGTDIKPMPETFHDVTKVENLGGKKGYKYTLTQRKTGKVIEVDPESPLNNVYQLKPSAKTVGGLHVIGTERHTARRIDNQLRGRSGRQGDAGSSRFYISLQDDLMKMFASEWTIKVLGFLGMEEGQAIEDKRISKGILRAQKKVEERNFLARKNLLEYDEVMDHQRTHFYGMRQKVLLGRNIAPVIWDMINDAITDAVEKYITEDYAASMVAEWARVNFEVQIDASALRGVRQLHDIEEYVRNQARTDVETNLSSTLREFMGEDAEDSAHWDTKSLQSWAMSRYQVNLSQAQMKKMSAEEVEGVLKDAALEIIDNRDCTPLERYLKPGFALTELALWAESKFGFRVSVDDMVADKTRMIGKAPEDLVELLQTRAQEAYIPREIEYPIEHAISLAFGPEAKTTENPYGCEYIVQWTYAKFRKELTTNYIQSCSLDKLKHELITFQEEYLEDGKLEKEVDEMIAANPDPERLALTANQRFLLKLTADDLKPNKAGAVGDDRGGTDRDQDGDGSVNVRDMLLSYGRQFLRRELTDLEQFVLIQIFDTSWKDHLYAMDMLKAGIGLQAFAEKDPRVLYKKEGYRFFQEMMAGIRDRVTDLIFRARVFGETERRSAYNVTSVTHETSDSYGVSETVGAEVAASAAAESGEAVATKTITRETPKVGRNDPCPCGSGKKYKKCHGATMA